MPKGVAPADSGIIVTRFLAGPSRGDQRQHSGCIVAFHEFYSSLQLTDFDGAALEFQDGRQRKAAVVGR
jgi:hypothetical protein